MSNGVIHRETVESWKLRLYWVEERKGPRGKFLWFDPQRMVAAYELQDGKTVERVVLAAVNDVHSWGDCRKARLPMPRPQVMVLKEKHSTTYFDVWASGGFPVIALEVFRGFDELGYYQYENEDRPGCAEPARPSDEALQNSHVAQGWARARLEYERAKQEAPRWDEERALYLRAKAGDAWAAASLLELRKGGEYEGYELENLVTAGAP